MHLGDCLFVSRWVAYTLFLLFFGEVLVDARNGGLSPGFLLVVWSGRLYFHNITYNQIKLLEVPRGMSSNQISRKIKEKILT